MILTFRSVVHGGHKHRSGPCQRWGPSWRWHHEKGRNFSIEKSHTHLYTVEGWFVKCDKIGNFNVNYLIFSHTGWSWSHYNCVTYFHSELCIFKIYFYLNDVVMCSKKDYNVGTDESDWKKNCDNGKLLRATAGRRWKERRHMWKWNATKMSKSGRAGSGRKVKKGEKIETRKHNWRWREFRFGKYSQDWWKSGDASLPTNNTLQSSIVMFLYIIPKNGVNHLGI